jgi:phage baseplate assembly protein W
VDNHSATTALHQLTDMSIIFYKIPLPLNNVMSGNELPACDLETSIHKNLELIITTKFGEHRSDPSFGCEIWELDFELIVSARLWEEKLRQSLIRSITSHETRITNTEIAIAVSDIEKYNVLKQFTEIKKRVDIKVDGVIKKTGEPFFFHTNLFLSPLSVD